MLNSLGLFICFVFYMKTKNVFMFVFVCYVEDKNQIHLWIDLKDDCDDVAGWIGFYVYCVWYFNNE